MNEEDILDGFIKEYRHKKTYLSYVLGIPIDLETCNRDLLVAIINCQNEQENFFRQLRQNRNIFDDVSVPSK